LLLTCYHPDADWLKRDSESSLGTNYVPPPNHPGKVAARSALGEGQKKLPFRQAPLTRRRLAGSAASREGLARPREARGWQGGWRVPSAQPTLPGFPSQSISVAAVVCHRACGDRAARAKPVARTSGPHCRRLPQPRQVACRRSVRGLVLERKRLAGAKAACLATIMSQAIMTNPNRVARAIQVYCSSRPVGMPKFFSAAAFASTTAESCPASPACPGWAPSQ
jgi:hypothetical protein